MVGETKERARRQRDKKKCLWSENTAGKGRNQDEKCKTVVLVRDETEQKIKRGFHCIIPSECVSVKRESSHQIRNPLKLS